MNWNSRTQSKKQKQDYQARSVFSAPPRRQPFRKATLRASRWPIFDGRHCHGCIVNSGTFTGILSPAELNASKLKWWALSKIGKTDQDLAQQVSNTETFQATVARMLGGMRANVAGPGSQSNAELGYLQQVVGGEKHLEKDTVNNILNNLESAGLNAARLHQGRLLAAAGSNPVDRTMLYGNYSLPLERMLPDAAIADFKRHVGTDREGAIRKIDTFFNTPGLGLSILQSGR